MARITLDRLRHSYLPDPAGDADWALKRIDLEWDDGGAYALLGPSGCGKTTLLNLVSGLLRPTRGRVLFDGADVTGLDPVDRHVAQVFQFPVVYDTMTVHANLAFPLRNRAMAPGAVDARVREVADMLDLGDKLARRASGLTADEKQKISLGRGLVRSDVNVIMFDEPLTVIDPHMKWVLRSKLKEIHRQFGVTMIYVTHDQTEALTFADTVVVMYEGIVVQVGTPVELFERPRHTFVGHFIGSPGMNVLPCGIDGGTAVFDGVPIPIDAATSRGSKREAVQAGGSRRDAGAEAARQTREVAAGRLPAASRQGGDEEGARQAAGDEVELPLGVSRRGGGGEATRQTREDAAEALSGVSPRGAGAESARQAREPAAEALPGVSRRGVGAEGGLELGVRPEFVRFSDAGFAVEITRVDDVGRHRIVDVRRGAHAFKMLVGEDEVVPSENPRVRFDPAYTRVYEDGWMLGDEADP